MGVAELHPFQNLPHDLLDKVLVSSSRVSLQVIQRRVINKLKDEKQTLLSSKHLNQVDQVLVPQLLYGEENSLLKYSITMYTLDMYIV